MFGSRIGACYESLQSLLHLAKYELSIDLNVLKTAASLHDIACVKEFNDKTGSVDHPVLRAEMTDEILRTPGYSEKKTAHVKHCIVAHRFRGKAKPKTEEAKILFDADKLDVLGAIGVARSFMMRVNIARKSIQTVQLRSTLRIMVLEKRLKEESKTYQNILPTWNSS